MSTSKSESTNVNYITQISKVNFKTLIPQWLLEFGVVITLVAIYLKFKYCILIGIVYLIFRAFITDFGWRCLKTLPRDLKGIKLLFEIQSHLRKALKLNRPIHEHFLAIVKKHPDKECVVEVESGRSLTFRQFNEHSNKYSNFFRSHKYKKNDVIGLFLENGIEFFATWLGLSKIGVISAWINSNLKLESLSHSIKISNCKVVISSQALLPKLVDAISAGLLDSKIQIFLVDENENLLNPKYESLVKSLKDTSEPPLLNDSSFYDILCYIYTSGTTGNPKAAIIRHYRYYYIGLACRYAFNLNSSDKIYITLPMYHSAGGILGIGQVVVTGITAVIRTRFSASNFWADCVTYNCTASQYIGEICRYLLAQKPSKEEKLHKIRIMFGNGLRPEIWNQFVQRFHLKRIGELYGSTEGNSNILNLDNHQGSCGFIPIYPFLYRLNLYPIRLIRINEETGELVRDPKTGLCVICKPGDVGEMVGTIRDNDPMLRFEGYVNGTDTKKKIIRDVIQKGDYVFSSGDILYWDKLGYLYFKDRRGDTYRWKGENCATTEVEGIIQPIMNVVDVAVYGVKVPNCEGRAGMITIAISENTNVQDLLKNIAKRFVDNLAMYAIPVFLRICDKVDRTGTFKLKKNDLRKDGYDLKKCNENMVYYWNSISKSYQKLDAEMQYKIDSGTYTRL